MGDGKAGIDKLGSDEERSDVFIFVPNSQCYGARFPVQGLHHWRLFDLQFCS